MAGGAPAARRAYWLAGLAFICLLGVPSAATAHPVPFSYVNLRLDAGAIEGEVIAHVYDLAHDLGIEPMDQLLDSSFASAQAEAIAALLAPRFQLQIDGRSAVALWSGADVLADRQSVRMRVKYLLADDPGVIVLDANLFPYDGSHQTFVNVYEDDRLTQAVLGGRDTHLDYYPGTRPGTLALVRRFAACGIHHILIGPDHLLFLVGLLLTGGTIRRLTLVATAFTVAHSVTLTLAALNVVIPPARLIEPAIALSVIYVGVDNLLVGRGRDMRAWIAFAFGFIHGFGFAGVLREMDVPARALGWSLFSFNAGVEIGQLMVVVVAASALGAIRSRNAAAGRRLAVTGSVVVVAAGTFWFVQRVFFPGGV
jgi:hydrogenase/urease accessory protein HupE